MIIGNLFQQFYTMVDSVVVGRFVGEQALAAVGASYSLTTVFISVANLVNLGIRVLIAVTCAPRWGIAFVWMAVPVGWLANYLISFGEYRTGRWNRVTKK